MVTTDGLRNGIAPNLSNASMAWAAKLTSLISMVVSLAIALYLPELHDPASASSAYGDMLGVQTLLLWQTVPTILCAIYSKTVNSTQLVAGIICGFGSSIALFLAIYRNPVGTPTAERYGVGGPNERGEMFVHPGIWGAVINIAVIFITNALGLNISMKELEFAPAQLKKYGQTPLSYGAVSEAMKNTVEPVFTPVGSLCMFLAFTSANVCLPFYKESMSDVTWVNGLPQWFVGCFCGYFIGSTLNLIAWGQWKTVDTESWFGPLTGKLDESTGGGTPKVEPLAGGPPDHMVTSPAKPEATKVDEFSFST